MLATVLRQAGSRGEKRMDEDGVDFYAAVDRPEQFPGMAAKVAILRGDDLRVKVVMRMLERQRGKIVGRDTDRTFVTEPLVKGRQEGFGFGDEIAATAAFVPVVPVVCHVDERTLRHDAVHRN